MIPRRIHQTAPRDTTKWKASWFSCQKTVFQRFHGFDYKLWTDEDLDQMVRQHFNWFYPVFRSYPEPIFRADAGRYMILYLYGGIYIDMDYEILSNFYSLLPIDKPSVVESPFPNVEKVQNSLMSSPPKHPFWLEVLREMASCSTIFYSSVLDSTGPRMLDRVLERTGPSSVYLLPMYQFNPPPIGEIYNATQWDSRRGLVYARHKCTASWR
jgi:mannosyltransferase OCH1-like enzyme